MSTQCGTCGMTVMGGEARDQAPMPESKPVYDPLEQHRYRVEQLTIALKEFHEETMQRFRREIEPIARIAEKSISLMIEIR